MKQAILIAALGLAACEPVNSPDNLRSTSCPFDLEDGWETAGYPLDITVGLDSGGTVKLALRMDPYGSQQPLQFDTLLDTSNLGEYDADGPIYVDGDCNSVITLARDNGNGDEAKVYLQDMPAPGTRDTDATAKIIFTDDMGQLVDGTISFNIYKNVDLNP